MIPIKIILIIFLVIILRAFLVQKELILVKRFVAFLMFFALLFLVLFPDISTQVANIIGVGRGVDLVFYFSHLFVLFLIIGLWRRSTILMATVAKLARAMALQNPRKPHERNEQTGERAV